jgi:dipeptidyl aminopeptidase/acylaminoacyl peptidase
MRYFLFLVACAGLLSLAGEPPTHSRAEALAREYPELPETIERRQVTIWSDGTRMAADLYLPRDRDPGAKLPAVIIVNGTGGIKRKLPARYAPPFVAAGYALLAFDFRGWGESDSRLVMTEPMPEPGPDGTVIVKARALRWQMDYADQTEDVRNCISYLSGDPAIDPARIGLIGTSYGGGLVCWVAAHDRRVKAAAIQVAGLGRMRTQAAEDNALRTAAKQARGETEVVPDKGGRIGKPGSKYYHMRYNMPKWVGFNPLESIHKITAPMLIIDAGNDELLNYHRNGEAVAKILREHECTVDHKVLPMTHYSVYGEHFEQVLEMEIAWFDTYLKQH